MRPIAENALCCLTGLLRPQTLERKRCVRDSNVGAATMLRPTRYCVAISIRDGVKHSIPQWTDHPDLTMPQLH
jgi:hypothetical protein